MDAGQNDLCIQCHQQGHGVANRRAIGHIATQRAAVAHGQAGKAGSELVQLRPLRLERGKGLFQRDSCSNAQLAVCMLDAFEFLGSGDVQHHVKASVVFRDPQTYICAASHDLCLRVICTKL